MKKIITVLVVGLLFLLVACASGEMDDPNSQNAGQPTTITATQARNMMEELTDFILLDVRTETEFQNRRIEGAFLLPYDEIKSRAEAELPDKDAVILLYCQSGRRSALAAASLAAIGYTNIYDFGGIINWPYGSISG